ncbi:MAG: BPSS1780 family membrane protein [Gammaproteobacteria bacterium]
MQLQLVPARTGWSWIRLGWKTFLRQPLALAGLFFMFMLLASLLSVIPVLGVALVLALMPVVNLGLMAATREADSGKFPMPSMLVTGLRGSRDRVRQLLLLGAGYAVAVAIILLLVSAMAGDAIGPLVMSDDPGTEELQAALQQRSTALLLALVFYTPVSMAFWHAPALVHWHGVPPVKALFFSLAACWANKWAMLVYLLGWGLVLMVVGNVISAIAAAMGGAQALQMVFLPTSMLMAAIFHTSIYFTYRDSFSDTQIHTPGQDDRPD